MSLSSETTPAVWPEPRPRRRDRARGGRPAGFSTGAVAPGDLTRALTALAPVAPTAVELSALRAHELPEVLRLLAEGPDAVPALAGYAYLSVHGPSTCTPEAEPALLADLAGIARRGIPVVMHPDALCDRRAWADAGLGDRLLIENMDLRKATGRTSAELEILFAELPEAGFCFDVGHAHQVDPSMLEAQAMLRRFGGRLREVHVSWVNTASGHEPMTAAAATAFRRVAPLIPPEVALIVEAPCDATDPEGLSAELARARLALAPPEG